MAIEFTWHVRDLERVPEMNGMSDVIRKVHFEIIATDPEYPDDTGRSYGDCTIGEPDPATFKEFEVLDEQDDVLKWAKAMTDVDAEKLEAAARRDLERKINPPTIMGRPAAWDTVQTTENGK